MSKNIKVFHNLNEMEEGQEYELTLQDYDLIKNDKLNDQGTVLFNQKLFDQ